MTAWRWAATAVICIEPPPQWRVSWLCDDESVEGMVNRQQTCRIGQY